MSDRTPPRRLNGKDKVGKTSNRESRTNKSRRAWQHGKNKPQSQRMVLKTRLMNVSDENE